ncbi:hypothetical protein DFQ27_007814 [Actinomortierella ambigua]|uniref:PIH1 N-terminal domain-containing protein n=1 Tax=Actinomortierella ambigua TaxID=1343610 RepID=A0A9P6TZM0_9FUNG|nr:hypothetical protein DFQ27_007814 [Actinomortierella ambigua]
MSQHAFLDFDERGAHPASSRLATVGNSDHSDDEDVGLNKSPFLLNPGKDNKKASLTKDERDAKDEEALLQEFMKNPKAALALAENYVNATTQKAKVQRTPLTEITPEPGFVVQTRTTKASQRPLLTSSGSKAILPKDTMFFINVCYAGLMPAPSKATEKEIQMAIRAEEGATYQVPFTISEPREYRDELARTFVVVDACIHPEPFRRAMGDLDYKLYIMELSMEWVEEKCHVDLSREFSLPAMKSKDELKKRPVLLPRGPAIQEVSVSEAIAGHALPTPSKDAQQPHLIVEQSSSKDMYVPIKGKSDIIPTSRLVPATDGTLGIVVEVELPNHVGFPLI